MTPQITLEQVAIMVRKQNEINSVVHPKWFTKGFDWILAAKMELMESIEHRGYKWWKDLNLEKVDWPQVQLEIVDAWHFHISNQLVRLNGDVKGATALLFMQLTAVPESDEDVPTDYNRLASNYDDWLGRGQGWINLLDGARMTAVDLFNMYISKNVLNHFRQAHGYKDGTYIKIWNGKEDNVRLSEIVAELTKKNLVTEANIMAHLEAAYKKVVEDSVPWEE